MKNRNYLTKPNLFSATHAHKNRTITYNNQGTITLKHPGSKQKSQTIPTSHQYPVILPTFLALDKSLTSHSNSPNLSSGKSLRQEFDLEYKKYLKLIDNIKTQWEPDYGSYLYDPNTNNIFLLAPEKWHRLALVTSTAKLLSDPSSKLTWEQIRSKLDNFVIGFVGASVGGNLIEGAMRELRPKTAKVADPDHVELTNLNRLERGSISHLTRSRATRNDPRNHFETSYVNKAQLAASQQHLVDPYMHWYVYTDGINGNNIDQFLIGNDKEPKLDLLVEEADDFPLKIEIRKHARKHKIPVLMLSDFGHRAQAQFQDFKKNPRTKLGYQVSDKLLQNVLDKAVQSGNRDDIFSFARCLAGKDFAIDEFQDWIKQIGEQPTNSLPQSGATALISGGIGGKLIALYALGHHIPNRFIFDAKNIKLLIG